MQNNGEKIKIIVVTGPTASGKTALGVALAKHYNGEVVSADSMQIYKGMSIGTAAATKEEMDGIGHHLLGFVDPSQEYSVSRYKEDSIACINDIASRGKMPIVVGGTGLYIDAILLDMDFTSAAADDEVRRRWQDYADEHGCEALHMQLERVDPASAERLHPNDVKRVIRALEVHEVTGRSISEQNNKTASDKFDPLVISLECENREYLYNRINLRVDIMIKNGLLDEIRGLLDSGVSPYSQSMKAIGYRQLIPCITEGADIEGAVESVKMETRRYAKRQLTWMRRRERIIIDIENKKAEDIAKEAISSITECGFLKNEG